MSIDTELCTKQSCRWYQQEACRCYECGIEAHNATELCSRCYEREFPS